MLEVDRECTTHHASDCIQAKAERYELALRRILAESNRTFVEYIPATTLAGIRELAREALEGKP